MREADRRVAIRVVELRKVTKELYNIICLLADHNLRDFHLIADRTNQMRKSYPFLEEDDGG